jgi:ubiquitin fusion degradation protein 1
MMKTLKLDDGDMIQIKSTDLAPATFVKLQPQNKNFLDISDPKAVLEKAFRDFATITQGDIFSFTYNDTIYDIAVIETKPTSDKMGVGMLETDVEVDFAPPIGYVEPTSTRGSGTSTPRSGLGLPAGGLLHNQGTMAQSINYDTIKPSSTAVLAGAKAASSHFLVGGHKLNAKKGAKTPTPKASIPVAGTSTNPPAQIVRITAGPQPLRLAPNKLFFGYDIIPIKTQADKDRENANTTQPHFAGQGSTLRNGPVKAKPEPEKQAEPDKKPDPAVGRRLDGKKA